MVGDAVLEKTVASEIHWENEKNPKKTKVVKKQKNKKTGAVREVTKWEDCPSFFDFFSSESLPTPEAMEALGEEGQEELAGKLEEDFDLGNDILNEIIPEALETYLRLQESGFSDLDNSDTDSDDE